MSASKGIDERAMRFEPRDTLPGTDPRLADGETVDIQAHIGTKLKALYAEVVNQPVPARLLELLKKLEAKDGEA